MTNSRLGSSPSRYQTFSRLLDSPLVDRYDFVAVNNNIMEQKATMAACERDPQVSKGNTIRLCGRWA